jgi:hypothetical protein
MRQRTAHQLQRSGCILEMYDHYVEAGLCVWGVSHIVGFCRYVVSKETK